MARLEAFFLPTTAGSRFCLYYPAAQEKERGSILYVHPFAEEMNKTRRMAAEQSRGLCAAGWNVLQVDLTGCGDSEGDFGEASWALWLADIGAAWNWMLQRSSSGEQWLWGARLGGLLAAAFMAGLPPDRRGEVHGALLWQPVLSGSQHLTQFLRLLTLQTQLDQSGGATLQSLRDRLNAGQSVEVAGYRLAPELALPMQAVELAKMGSIPPRTHWFEISSQVNSAISPASQRVIELWRERGAALAVHLATGPAFWQTQEIEMCPELLNLTIQALERDVAIHPEDRKQ